MLFRSLATAPDVPLEERVGDGRIGTVGSTATGEHSNGTKMTWSDIARMPRGLEDASDAKHEAYARSYHGKNIERCGQEQTSLLRPYEKKSCCNPFR